MVVRTSCIWAVDQTLLPVWESGYARLLSTLVITRENRYQALCILRATEKSTGQVGFHPVWDRLLLQKVQGCSTHTRIIRCPAPLLSQCAYTMSVFVLYMCTTPKYYILWTMGWGNGISPCLFAFSKVGNDRPWLNFGEIFYLYGEYCNQNTGKL